MEYGQEEASDTSQELVPLAHLQQAQHYFEKKCEERFIKLEDKMITLYQEALTVLKLEIDGLKSKLSSAEEKIAAQKSIF